MKKKAVYNEVRISPFVLIMVIGFFLLFIGRVIYLCMVSFKVGSMTIGEFVSKRNMKAETIFPVRGTIYDSTGTILAQDVSSYTVIAYLSEKRDIKEDEPLHVVDKELTAEKLAPLINMTKEEVLKLLSKENLYQVELGPGGRNITQSVVEEIKKLELPGIDFVKSTKRYYPNGNYASYTLGYTVKKVDEETNEGWTVGELGIEGYYNDILRGKEGYLEYEKDKNGYKIPNGRQYVKDAQDGDDIYLTLDNNIQLFAENAIAKSKEETNAEWTLLMVVDAKTGAILGNASSPSFDPNIRDMTSYLNPFVAYSYEPGSTMKIFSYMCAIEKGTYDGNAIYKSGSKDYHDLKDPSKITTINDWNKQGWGYITYDEGFMRSSNIAVATLLDKEISKSDLKTCYEKYGFGQKTDFTMSGELKGNIAFNYPVEVANAGYGQGIATTPMQHVQALTALANNGEMLKPYIISKIIDPNTGKITSEGQRTVVREIASGTTINKMKDLMRNVVQGNVEIATGSGYNVAGYDVIGKTGTAQIFDSSTGKYFSGSNDYIYSFSGMFPYDDPDIIIYAAMKKPVYQGGNSALAKMVREVISNVGNYYALDHKQAGTSVSYEMGTYISKSVSSVKNELSKNGIDPIVIGTGSKIMKQYPSNGTIINSNDKVFLLTDTYEKKMPNLYGYSYKEATGLLDVMDIYYTTEGDGHLYEQSVSEGEIITRESNLILKFKIKYENS